MRVRVSPAAHNISQTNLNNLSCVLGVAVGDGNLSNPNGRATKLRVTCDIKYPKLICRIIKALELLLPSHSYKIEQKKPQKDRYNIRVSKNSEKFIKTVSIAKE